MGWVAFSLVVPALIGMFAADMLFPCRRPAGLTFLVRTMLCVGLGIGISSIIRFWLLLGFGAAGPAFTGVEVAVVVGLAAFSYGRFRNGRAPLPNDRTDEPAAEPAWGRNRVILALMFCLSCLWVLYCQVDMALLAPHGGWDAWGTWNLKARYLFRGGGDWQRIFSEIPEFYRPDYPLMLPISIAGFWHYASAESQLVPAALGITFTFATVLLVAGTVGIVADWERGMLAGLALLGGKIFVTMGVSQYADVPLSFFFAGTVAAVLLADHYKESRLRLVALAGVLSGLSGWLKNEGVLFTLCVAASILLVEVCQRGLWDSLRVAAAFLGGLMVSLPTIGYLKIGIGASSNVIDALTMEAAMRQLADPWRYFEVGKAYLLEFFDPSCWGVVVYVMILTAGMVGFAVRKDLKGATAVGLLIVGGTLAGYFAVYLLSPYNLTWYLTFSISRLYVQLWPCMILIYFASLALFTEPHHQMKSGRG